ncbi:MAG: SCP2 sterol-binding domain-containing protein [Candidatus Dormibacteraeota bacterium]|nr:SCP2 sterol-binding domain-containing protein [Candidatus Dormibacteraeota bacterium]
MTDELTPEQVFQQMPNDFQADKAGSLAADIQFDLSGANPGRWWVKIADGRAETGQGDVANPKLTLRADSADWVKIATNQLDPTSAFMSGKLKLQGDMGLAIKFGTLFRRA